MFNLNQKMNLSIGLKDQSAIDTLSYKNTKFFVLQNISTIDEFLAMLDYLKLTKTKKDSLICSNFSFTFAEQVIDYGYKMSKTTINRYIQKKNLNFSLLEKMVAHLSPQIRTTFYENFFIQNIIQNNVKSLKTLNFSKIDINGHFPIPKSKYCQLNDFIANESNLEIISILLVNNYKVDNNFFISLSTRIEPSLNPPYSFPVNLGLKEISSWKVSQIEKDKLFEAVLYNDNNSRSFTTNLLLDIANNTKSKKVMSKICDILINNNKILYIFILFDMNYNLSVEQIKCLKKTNEIKYFMYILQHRYKDVYENVLHYFI